MKLPIRKILNNVTQNVKQRAQQARKPPVHQPASDEQRIAREMNYAHRIQKSNPRLKIQEERRRATMERRSRYGR